MLRSLLLIFILSAAFFSNGQNTTVVVAGDTITVHGYNPNNQDSTIVEPDDTTIVVGNNPKYYFKNRFQQWELNYKLPKGTYKLYRLNGKYKKKVHTVGYEVMEKEIAKKKKYRGNLYRIVTFGDDSLKTGTYTLYRYDVKTKKDVCYGLINYSKGIKEGIAVEYYNDGKIRSVGNYKDGKEDGSWFFFGNNPFEVTEVKYDNGKRLE